MIGKKFGMLQVIECVGVDSHRQKKYLCLCECGKETNVLGSNLRKGNSTSCGCKRKKTCSMRMVKLNLRHGMTNTKLWKTWAGVVERTTVKTSSHYHRYGAVGIGIHPDWLNFEKFAAYLGNPPSDKHSIDRIDNNKGYLPGNIRWATAKEQAANRKTNIRVLIDGIPMILAEAAKTLGVSKSTVSRWYACGKLKHA